MRKWMWIVPVLLLAGCSKTNSQNGAAPVAATQPAGAPGAPAQTAEAPAEPVVAAPSPFGDSTPGTAAPAAPAPGAAPAFAPATAPAPPPVMIIPAGTRLHVRVEETIDTRRNRAGDGFGSTLEEPIVVHGQEVVPRGTVFHGHVTTAAASGRLRGRAVLVLTLDGFRLNGQVYRVRTSAVERVSASHKKRNLALIGGGGGLGAIIGAIAGGGKGAAIGAGAGAAAGLGGAAATGKKEVGVAAEAPLTFVMRAPVRM